MLNMAIHSKSNSRPLRVAVWGASVLVAGLLVGLTSAPAEAGPTFKCRGNLNSAEWTICGNNNLGNLDQEMSSEYYFQRGQLGSRERKRLQRDQRSWLHQRNSCGSSVHCLRREYLDRIEQLREWGL